MVIWAIGPSLGNFRVPAKDAAGRASITAAAKSVFFMGDPLLEREAAYAGNRSIARLISKVAAGMTSITTKSKCGKNEHLERVAGIEPAYSAWKAAALPLS